jgi:glycosyltransferase involved in cell wall biosynthesis
MTSREPAGLSIIVPARNAADTLARCLAAIAAQITPDDELLVIDDHSSDATAEVARRFATKVITLPAHRGAAAARNRGAAEATRPVLFFLDADVVLGPRAMERARCDMSDPAFDAVVGSYDDAPAERSPVSMFKNLAHHYFHQRSAGNISSFFGACGLVRRRTLLAAGGYDERRFRESSIEDVEFGYRLSDAGARIRIDPDLRVTHLKGWTLGSLLVTDFTRRAVPWSILYLERGDLPAELNITGDQRIAALVALGLAACAPLALLRGGMVVPFVVLLVAAVWINARLFRLFYAKGGVGLMLAGFALQQLYYLYSLAGLATGAVLFAVRGRAALPIRGAAARRRAAGPCEVVPLHGAGNSNNRSKPNSPSEPHAVERADSEAGARTRTSST